MPEESCNVPQSIRLVPVDRIVIVPETLLEGLRPLAVKLAEPLTHVAVELAVGAFLRTTLDDHVAQLNILTFGNL